MNEMHNLSCNGNEMHNLSCNEMIALTAIIDNETNAGRAPLLWSWVSDLVLTESARRAGNTGENPPMPFGNRDDAVSAAKELAVCTLTCEEIGQPNIATFFALLGYEIAQRWGFGQRFS